MDPFVHLGDAVLPEGVRARTDGRRRGRTRPVDGHPRSHGHGHGLVLATRRPRRGPCRGGPELSRVRLHPVRAPGDRRSRRSTSTSTRRPNLHSPPVLGVLLARVEQRHVLLAPLDHPHEQVIACRGRRTRLGLARRPRRGACGLLHDARDLRRATRRPSCWIDGGPRCEGSGRDRSRDANPIVSHLSYWTDNGAAYWYRTEAGRTIGASVAEAVEALRADGVPIRAVELDSWCYQHEVPRPIAEIGYPEEVPPSGLMRWEPRADAFDPPPPGRDPIEQLAERLGRPPLVIHARHISPHSPYLAEGEWWVDALAAHPVDPTFFRRWFDDARRWGVCAIEQDWMLLYVVRCPSAARRTGPGCGVAARARRAGRRARRRADLVHGHAGRHRARGDARSRRRGAHQRRLPLRRGPGAAVDVVPHRQPPRRPARTARRSRTASSRAARPPGDDAIDGDEHAELEALLACMSAGPVGIGDRIGCTDREVVMRTCDDDGRIRHVDRPLALGRLLPLRRAGARRAPRLGHHDVDP